MNIQQPFVIISAEQSDASPRTNILNTEALRTRLLGWRSKPLVGSYKGALENSFLAIISSEAGQQQSDLSELLDWALAYGQESILLVDVNRHAELLFPLVGLAPQLSETERAVYPHLANARRYTTASLGPWSTVTESTALACDGFTYDPAADQYFVAGDANHG